MMAILINLFADDMLLYGVISNAYDMELVQQGIDYVGDWVNDNNLCLNSSILKFMIVSKFKSRGIQDPILKLHDNQLQSVRQRSSFNTNVKNTGSPYARTFHYTIFDRILHLFSTGCILLVLCF